MKLKAEKTERIKTLSGETKAVWVTEFSLQGGIDLRDYFAAKAMEALIPIYWETESEFESPKALVKCNVETAYEYADAMLAERNKGREEE